MITPLGQAPRGGFEKVFFYFGWQKSNPDTTLAVMKSKVGSDAIY